MRPTIRLLAVAACAAAVNPASAASNPPGGALQNAVLISLDSVRADQLPMYGYPRNTTPFLAELVAEGKAVVFPRMTAASPSCHPSHTSMVTGLWPQQVGIARCAEEVDFAAETADTPKPLVRKKVSAVMNWLRIPESATTIAQLLHDRGFATGGFVSIWTLQSRFGYARGFDRFEDEMPEYYGPKGAAWVLRDVVRSQRRRPAEATTEGAVDFVSRVDPEKRFFLFVNLADTHVPYAAPPGTDFPGESGETLAAVRAARSRRYPDAIRDKAFAAMARPDGGSLLDDYDRAILHSDRLVRRIYEALRERGLADRTLFVVTADHGDSFGQHDLFFEHSVHVWEETQHVPLVVADPSGRVARGAIDANVSTVDLVPTILSALDVDPAGLSVGALPGRDLALPSLPSRRVHFLTFGRGKPPVLRGMFADYPSFIGFRDGDLKFFVDRKRFLREDEGRCRMFDLRLDPDELHDLCADPAERDRAAAFRRQVVAWYNRTVEPRATLGR